MKTRSTPPTPIIGLTAPGGEVLILTPGETLTPEAFERRYPGAVLLCLEAPAGEEATKCPQN